MAISEARPEPANPEPNWGELIERVAQADEAAMARLYDLTSPSVFGLVLKILRDRAAAEEVTLDVYVQVWKQAGQFSTQRGSATSWLLMMARSRAIDHIRSRSWREQEKGTPLDSAVELPSAAPTPEQSTAEAKCHRVVKSAVESLDPRQRETIELAFFSGLTHSEIAQRLDQPLGTVKTRIRQGMQHLRETLQPFAEAI